MKLQKNEFMVLNAIRKNPNITQREISDETELSIGTVNSITKRLKERCFVSDRRLTEEGEKALEPYKVDNAVIMAAGLSSRFAPISYNNPKGLLVVRGEILIERQIRQLQEAGIKEIVVVVGYKQEQFFYLEDKFGVKILVNPDYASRNNNSSLMVAREFLKNTYICCSDMYYTENPFEQYVWKAFYATIYKKGYSAEDWFVEVGPNDVIRSISVGGESGWCMIEHVYFDRAFSKKIIEIIKADYDSPQLAAKVWDEIYLDHYKDFSMMIKKFDQGIINEFDSLDQVREFDVQFIRNIDSEVLTNITNILGCSKEEIRDIAPIKQGTTNLSFRFKTDQGEYVYRHPGVGTEKLTNRKVECRAQAVAKKIGIDSTFIFEDPQSGWKISHYVSDAVYPDKKNPADLKKAMEIASKLHSVDSDLGVQSSPYDEIKRYESILSEKGPIAIEGYEELAEQIRCLNELAKIDDSKICITHNDFAPINMLKSADGSIQLIDWEYACMSDYANDLAIFVIRGELSEDEVEQALEFYFGRIPSKEERRHVFAYVALMGWWSYLWALIKEAEGEYLGEWTYLYYTYTKNYIKKALELF